VTPIAIASPRETQNENIGTIVKPKVEGPDVPKIEKEACKRYLGILERVEEKGNLIYLCDSKGCNAVGITEGPDAGWNYEPGFRELVDFSGSSIKKKVSLPCPKCDSRYE